jgi:hypothetical protein
VTGWTLERRGDLAASWRDHAACHGLGHLMDPRDPTHQQTGKALTLCRSCPAETACARWVMSLTERDDPGGVCGGMTEITRRHLRLSAKHAAARARRKTCTRCGKAKPPEAFHRDRHAKDGRKSACAACLNAAGRAATWERRAERDRLAGMSTPELLAETIEVLDVLVSRRTVA